MSIADDALRLDNQLCFPLYAAAKAIVRSYEPFLGPLGLTYTQYIVMMVLWEKGEATINEVGEKVLLDSGTLSPLVNKLIAKGYLEKTKGVDGRERHLTVTSLGWELKEKCLEIPAKIGSCVKLEPQEGMELYRLCHKVLEGFE